MQTNKPSDEKRFVPGLTTNKTEPKYEPKYPSYSDSSADNKYSYTSKIDQSINKNTNVYGKTDSSSNVPADNKYKPGIYSASTTTTQ